MANVAYSKNSVVKAGPKQPGRQRLRKKSDWPQAALAQWPAAFASPQHIRELQRTLGNRAVQRMLAQQGAVQRTADRLPKTRAAGIQRMTVQFLPTANDDYVNPMTVNVLNEKNNNRSEAEFDPDNKADDEKREKLEGVFTHKGYKRQPGEEAPDVKKPNRRVEVSEDLNIIGHGRWSKQTQGGLNAKEMARFIKRFLPESANGKAHYDGTIDLIGCLTASRFVSKLFEKSLAQQVSELITPEYPHAKVRGYAGITHAGQPEFGLEGPIEITPLAYKFGQWAKFIRLGTAYENDPDKTALKLKEITDHVAKMWASGAIRRPQPITFP